MAFSSTLMKPEPDGLEVMVMDEDETVKVAEAELELASVAFTVLLPPGEVSGTAKLALNKPLLLEVTVDGDVVCPVPLYVIVIVDEAAKPVPFTVTVVPIRPLVGVMVIDGVTLKVADAEYPLVSVALAVLLPAVDPEGTVKVAVNEPVPLETTGLGFVVTLVPANCIVICELGQKLEPDTVTDVPTGPLVGDKAIEETVTVKVVEAEWLLASVAWTVLLPVEDDGTVNEPENEPVLSVVIEAGVVVTLFELNFIVMAELAAKPWPDTVTDVPGSPLVGLMLIEAALTLKVAVAELPY